MAKTAFPRGVKLPVEIVYDPINDMAADLGNAALEQAQQTAPVRFQWTVGHLNSRMFEEAKNRLCLPFIIPPFQQDFDLVTKRLPPYRVILNEISISWDQRAEAWAITDEYFNLAEGFLSSPDLERLTVHIKLCEKVPTLLGGLASDRTEVLSFDLPGVETYGSPDFRSNPLLIDGLYVPLHPFRTYWFEVTVPGLYAPLAGQDRLAMPSFTIHVKASSPLFNRDTASDDTQNLPTCHNGNKQTSINPVITTPSADALIDGTNDIQATLGQIDQVFLDRLKSGYGDSSTPGMESDAFAWEQANKDAAYSVIVVPMWQGYEDWRASETAAKGLPYTVAPWITPTIDRRLLVVPEGFCLHHAYAVQSTNAPPCPNTGVNATWGTIDTSVDLHNRVGVALTNGLRGDDYLYQQVAFADWTPNSLASQLIDTFQAYVNDPTIPNFWNIVHLPLVSDAVGVPSGFYTTGPQLFMGRANNRTRIRTDTGDMPANFGGAAYGTPVTSGCENMLEFRWQIVDTVQGLDHPAEPDAVRVGTGGHWIVLIGKTVLHA